MCNEEFENVLIDAFSLRQIPSNLFKFIQNDVESLNQLKKALNNLKQTKDPAQIRILASTEFEIIFNKELITKIKIDERPRPPQPPMMDDMSEDMYEDFELKYAAFSFRLDPIKFKNSNSILVHMKPINGFKSKIRLLGQHTKIINSVIVNNMKRMELLHRSLIQDKQIDI